MTIVGIGVDIVEIGRIKNAYERQPRLATRILTPAEVSYCSFDSVGWPARLAACFALKEAAAKALGCGIGRVAWKELELQHAASGAPLLRFHGAAALLAEELNIQRAHASLSHEKTMAVAMVVLEQERS